MFKKHMKSNEVDLDRVTPNLVLPKEVLDLLGDMIKHPENHREDFERFEKESLKRKQKQKIRMKTMIDTGLFPDGQKIPDSEMFHLKQHYDKFYANIEVQTDENNK